MTCAGCEADRQPSGTNIESAYEVRLTSDQDRRHFLTVVDQAALDEEMHLELGPTSMRLDEVFEPIKVVDAQVLEGADHYKLLNLPRRSSGAHLAAIMDLGDGRAWMIFLRDRDSAAARHFREHVVADLEVRWPGMIKLQQSADGALPRMFKQ